MQPGRGTKMLTTTTTRAVKFHGWTLPKGATVTVTDVRREVYSPVEQFTTASCTSDAAPTYGGFLDAARHISIPTDALAATYTELATIPWQTDYLY